jgi:hypothetical protein
MLSMIHHFILSVFHEKRYKCAIRGTLNSLHSQNLKYLTTDNTNIMEKQAPKVRATHNPGCGIMCGSRSQ